MAAKRPVVTSTWNFGETANAAAWEGLSAGASALDSVEAGVRVAEADPEITSVGYGGLPDRDGNVTLDACVMNERGEAGSVVFLHGIKHPASVARQVMEHSPHVLLAGEGALQFALSRGFQTENLLTPRAEAAWREWRVKGDYDPEPNVENHDTIGMLAIDSAGNLSGACTSSGLAFKMRGRVGDSPIIGAGLYVDNEVGAACATGMGELILRELGSFLIVELMRAGRSPGEACREAMERLAARQRPGDRIQVGYLALGKNGEVGGFGLREGFEFASRDGEGSRLHRANSL